MQINVRRIKINHLLFIAQDLTVCIKLRNCDILYQFHLRLFLFMTGSVYFSCSSANKQTRFHVNGIERASRLDMQTSLWISSNDKHILKLDTLIAAERSKILRRHGLT